MFWWILIGIIFILTIIFYICIIRDEEDGLSFTIIGFGLIVLLLVIGTIVSASIDAHYSIEDMKIKKTEEAELLPFSISTPDEITYVGAGQNKTNKCYWYNKKDIKSSSGQNLTSIGIGSDVNFYETDKTPYMTETVFVAEKNFFAMWIPRHTKYDFYIPKDSIKYGITITEE